MAVDQQLLCQALDASLNPAKNKEAELAIQREGHKPNFSLALLQIVASQSISSTIRLAGALYFKNHIKRNWIDEDGNYKLSQNEVDSIKRELIGLMVSVPANIQFQLGDAIGIIADSDFWEKWDTLVDDLAARLTSDKPTTNNGVLQVAHSIYKRWRPLYRSDPLFLEINHVLQKFGTPFLQVIADTDRLIEQNHSNKATLLQVFSSLNLIVKLIYDLSVQDLPPLFEDRLPMITGFLHKYLVYENKLLETDDDVEAGPLEHVKAGILEILELWEQKYEDAFGDHVRQFVETSWNLLTKIGPAVKFDLLVSRALQFLTAITKSVEHAQTFGNESVSTQVIERVILPSVTLRDSDMEVFEEEPIEFIRRDLEGSDSDTRRRAATDFLRGLLAKFEQLISAEMLRYIDHYLSQYANNTSGEWKSKDTATYLYSAIAAKGATTASQGVTATNDFANVVDFFQKNIAQDLMADTGVHPILKVDAIKYLYSFRSQITPQQWQDAFPLLVKHLGSPDYVVYTYAAIALERVMALTTSTKQPVINRLAVEQVCAELLRHLFALIESNTEAAKLQENEFLMRCVMRVLIIIKEGVAPITDDVLPHLLGIANISSQNPSNPRFCYYLFEALGAFIRFVAPAQPDQLEAELYPAFADILAKDVQEFVPYTFQLLAACLEANPSGSLSPYYLQLIPPILTPSVWASKGNVPALVRLLSAIIPRGTSEIIQNGQLETILGVFSQLVGTKTNEAYGFELLETIVASFAPAALEKYYVSIIQILLTRLQNSRTDQFALRFVRLYHFVSAKEDKGLGADFFINVAEQVSNGVFVPLYLNIILPETQKLVRPLDRKIAVISLAYTLTNSTAFSEKYKKGWAYTCEALLKLLENPPSPPATDDIIAEADPDDMSFGVGFTQLTTIKRPPRDGWPEITDIKTWVSSHMMKADKDFGGRISTFAKDRLSPQTMPMFAAYIQ